jgi:hypothetical protein
MTDESIRTGMLANCSGSVASAYPHNLSWARKAVSFLLELGFEGNGKRLTAPA